MPRTGIGVDVHAFAPVGDVRRTLTPVLRTDKGETELVLVDLGRLEAALRPDTVLVSLMQVNNETGVAQPLADYAALLAGAATPLVEAYAEKLRGLAPFDLDVAQRYLLLKSRIHYRAGFAPLASETRFRPAASRPMPSAVWC